MEKLFSQILNMSLTASVVIVIVLLARLALKKAPKIYSYALWAVVLFRLICPVSIQSPVSVLEVAKPEVIRSEGIATSISYIPARTVEEDRQTPERAEGDLPRETEKESRFSADAVPPILWAAGVAVMLLRGIAQYLQLRRSLIGALCLRGNIYLADHIPTPFVMGIVTPKIYLPSGISGSERRYIVAHERHHIRRGDHVIKLLAYYALSLHWFNPLVWIAFVQAGKDMEMSCDEAVIKKLGSQIRGDYSASLLRLASRRRIIGGTPLAFGEGDTKGRIRNMAKWKKPRVWVSVVCILLCIAVLAACAVNPETKEDSVSSSESEQAANGMILSETGEILAGNPEIVISISGSTVQFGNLTMELPQLYTLEQTAYASADFLLQEERVGGITCWTYPEFQPADIVELRKKESGVPIGYMSSSSAYGDVQYEIFWDGNPDGLNEKHIFFIDGDIIYDVWYDRNQISTGIAERFLKTVAINGDPVIEENPDEQTALAKCRAVLEAVQNGSCHIVVDQSSTGNTESHWSTANYYQDNENWLKIVDVDPETDDIVDGEQFSFRMAFMVADSIRYSNEGKFGKAYTDIQWKEDDVTFDDSVKPWLASFLWDDSVAYMDTLTDEDGECVMLRVDKKYIDSDDYDPHYFLFFNFDLNGNFVNAKLQVNLFRDNELAITESIASMDADTVAAEIQKEYDRAVG